MKIRLITLLLGAIYFPGLACAGDTNPGQGSTLELYAQTTDFYAELTMPFQPGQRAIYGRDLYALGGTEQAPQPIGEKLGRQALICTVISPTEASCQSTWLLYELGQITGSAFLDFAAPPDAFEPGAPLTGGSGEFSGAAGVIFNQGVAGTSDQVWYIDISGFSDQ